MERKWGIEYRSYRYNTEMKNCINYTLLLLLLLLLSLPTRSLPTTNLHQNLDLIILIMNQALETLLFDLCEFDSLGDHFMRAHTAITQGIEDFLEISDFVGSNAEVGSLFEIKVICEDGAWFLPDGDVDDAAACSGCVNGLGEGCLYAGTVVDDVDAFVVGEFAAALGNVFFGWVDDIVCAEFLCKFLSLLAYF